MKKSLLFSAVLAGLMLGSCSSSDDLAGGNTPANQEGNGYVAFNINLPSQSGSSSRAANDNFDDGTPNEYDVKDATLLLFNGADEKTATFTKAYQLSTAPWNKNADDNVTTTSATIVKKIDAPTDKCYALVILNNNGVFKLSGTDITFEGATGTFSGTLDDFLKSTSTKNTNLTEKGFYMANAPLASLPGGNSDPKGSDISTLVNLNGKIKATEADAKLSPAQIFVERGVAKVTMQNSSSTPTIVDGSKKTDGTSTVGFKLTSWALDNTNKSTYWVRSTEGFGDWLSYSSKKFTSSPNYRFVGSKAVPNSPNLYRTYFAKDANFDKAQNTVASFGQATSFSGGFGDEKPQYCFENTFDVESQNDNFTTRVLIKAALNSGETFYVINGDENTIYTRTEVENEIKRHFLSEYEGWIKKYVTSPTSITGNEVVVDFTDKAGAVSINSIGFASTVTTSTSLPSDVASIVTSRLGSIMEYYKGESYYFVRIKHFGDELTPWEKGQLGVEDVVYPGTDAENNWLGRYGVLRNNWYDIQVTGVKGLGSAEVPKVTPDPDDELQSYIAVKINVLSWAKRTQGAVLH